MDPRIVINYRGLYYISLISTVYKLYSGTANNRLTNVFEPHNILADEQNGFRKGNFMFYLQL